ncbi:hypothetical protein B7494_g7689 [Chlorociboria aeruginascens]|nr:hypothetical protein B7494_g7689 [Chlorociboria aeruginascens]
MSSLSVSILCSLKQSVLQSVVALCVGTEKHHSDSDSLRRRAEYQAFSDHAHRLDNDFCEIAANGKLTAAGLSNPQWANQLTATFTTLNILHADSLDEAVLDHGIEISERGHL